MICLISWENIAHIHVYLAFLEVYTILQKPRSTAWVKYMGCFGQIYRCAFSQVEEVCHIFERSEGDAGIFGQFLKRIHPVLPDVDVYFEGVFSQVARVVKILSRSEGDADVFQWGFGERSELKRGPHWSASASLD